MYSYKILQTNPNTLLITRYRKGSKEGKAIIFGSEKDISALRTIDISENNQDNSSAFKIFGQIADGERFDERLVSEIKEENKKNTVKEALNFINEGGFVKPGFTGIGLTDSFIKSYSAIHIGNRIIIPSKFDEVMTNTDNDILLNYNGHYSSLPIISVNKQRYLFDSAGNLHQNSSGRIEDEIAKRFSGIQSLNPFGLNYQNNSNACGIWSANILNQVQEFKKAVKESEIVKTYTGSDEKPYKILNPEILLRAAAQVSKDLTPEGEKPEIRILQEGQQPEEKYAKLKIGNTTFAINTTYKSDRCIDIEAIALSIPREELSQEIDNQNFIKRQEEIAAKVFSPMTGSLTKEEKERRERLEQICKIRFTPTELINIRPPRSQPPNPQTTPEQKPLLPKPTSNPVLKCLNFNVAKQKLEKQQPPQSTPPKPQQKQSILHPQ